MNPRGYWERLAREVGATAIASDGGDPPPYPLPPLAPNDDWTMRTPEGESDCDEIFESQR